MTTAYITVKVEIDDKHEDRIHEDSVHDTVSGFLKNHPSYLDMSHVKNIEALYSTIEIEEGDA